MSWHLRLADLPGRYMLIETDSGGRHIDEAQARQIAEDLQFEFLGHVAEDCHADCAAAS